MTYKLTLNLEGTDISRIVSVPDDMDFERLHRAIVVLLGLDDSPSWLFRNADCTLRTDRVALVERDWSERRWTTDPHLVLMRDIFTKVGKRMYYENGSDDEWRVVVRRAKDPRSEGLACLKTEGAFAFDENGDEPTAEALTALMEKEVAPVPAVPQLTETALYAYPGKQHAPRSFARISTDTRLQDEIVRKHDEVLQAWNTVMKTRLTPLVRSTPLGAEVVRELGLKSTGVPGIVCSNLVEREIVRDYALMVRKDGAETPAERFVRTVERGRDAQEDLVADLLASYRYRCLRVKCYIVGLGLIVTDLFEGKDYLLVHVPLSKCGSAMTFASMFGGTVVVDGTLFATHAPIPYDLPNVERIIDHALEGIGFDRMQGRVLTATEQQAFAAKMIGILVSSGCTGTVLETAL